MRIAFITAIIGLIWTLISFFILSGHVIPYQDPTPEMLQQQSADIVFWQSSIVIGLTFTGASILGFLFFKYRKKK